MVSRGMSTVASPLPPPNPAGSAGRNPYCDLTPSPRAPPPPFCTAPNQHLISTLQKPNARDLSHPRSDGIPEPSPRRMCVLVSWLGGLEEEREQSRAEKRAVRGFLPRRGSRRRPRRRGWDRGACSLPWTARPSAAASGGAANGFTLIGARWAAVVGTGRLDY